MGDPFSTRPSAVVSSVEQTAPSDPAGARFRIEDIYPLVDCGRAAVKRIAGEPITVWADIFRDGHDEIAAALRWRRTTSRRWNRAAMQFHSNDRWTGSFTPPEPGSYVFDIEAWTDAFGSWRKATLLKKNAGQDVSVDIKEGLALIEEMKPADKKAREAVDRVLSDFNQSSDPAALTSDDMVSAMAQSDARPDATHSAPMPLLIERERARCGAWYEMVPRSQGKTPGKHGTFDDCVARVPEIAALGFDVLYFTPIHPIGHTNRKGKNNALKAAPGDPGSFYAIGDESGGHAAVHRELGTVEDFRRLVDTCKQHGMEVALDFAVQCSPDHPWLKQHPEWFKWRPDGSVRYAENPPKKYQDIVNVDFYAPDAMPTLWQALRDIVLFWRGEGVRIFRVDNPH